jgi:O-antigen/teichoic acid export membrane protein
MVRGILEWGLAARSMNRIRRNIVANTLGRGWATFLGVAILPLYMRFLGPEAYGLVGLYATIAVICSLFDVGISASLGREIARARAQGAPSRDIAELVRTAEVLYVGVGVVLGGVVAMSAPLIVSRWLNIKELSPTQATEAVRLMALYLSMQWSIGLYSAGLSGLQKQVELNIVTSIASTIRAGGAVIVLAKVSSSIVSFYWWQVIATAAYLLVAREVLWRSPEVGRMEAEFRWSVTLRVRGFAANLTVLSFASVLVSQLDKIVLTGMVSLKSFGYYALATSISAAAAFFGQPVLGAIYPAMIAAHARGDAMRLGSLFHRGAQLVSVATFAPAAVLFAFAPVALRLWARDPATASNAAELVSVSVIGAALNAAAVMPYNLSLAAGRVRPAMVAAALGILIHATTLGILAPRIGVMAGAVGSTLVHFSALFVYGHWAVNPLLPSQAWRWLRTDLFIPFSTAMGVALGIRALAPPEESVGVQLAGLVFASIATLVCTVMVTDTGRREIMMRVQRSRSSRC